MALPAKPPIQREELIFTDMAQCRCGARLALYVYDARRWHCSAELLGTAIQEFTHSEPISVHKYAYIISR